MAEKDQAILDSHQELVKASPAQMAKIVNMASESALSKKEIHFLGAVIKSNYNFYRSTLEALD